MNELRDEIELPALDVTDAERSVIENMRPMAPRNTLLALERLACRERQLKSSLAANREQKAEIERMTDQWAATDHTLKHDCNRALVALSGAGICTPAETYGVNTSWAISDLCRAVVKQSEELRASVGEKWIDVKQQLPLGEDHLLLLNEDPARAVIGYWNRLTKCWMVNYTREPDLDVTHWQPLPAPPTLPTEKEK